MRKSIPNKVNKLRKKFEEWAESKCFDLSRCENPHCERMGEHYREGSGMNTAFAAYQAGLREATPLTLD